MFTTSPLTLVNNVPFFTEGMAISSFLGLLLKIFRPESSPLANLSEHARTDLIPIVKCEDIVGPAWAGKDTVGPLGLTLDGPADLHKSGKYLTSLG